MNIIIREAIFCDLEKILNLYNQPDMDNGNVLTLGQARDIFEKMQRYPDYKLYVADDCGDIVGTFALAIMDNLAHMGIPSGLIEDVVVRTNMQGSGIGKKMMERAIQICKDKGCYKVALSSNIKRESAHKFYDSIGFKRHGYSFFVELSEEKV